MAQADPKFDYTPLNTNIKARGASVAALRTALSTYNSTSYTSARLDAMTKDDLHYAVKLHSLSVTGV